MLYTQSILQKEKKCYHHKLLDASLNNKFKEQSKNVITLIGIKTKIYVSLCCLNCKVNK